MKNISYYKENRGYGKELRNERKLLARERNVKQRLKYLRKFIRAPRKLKLLEIGSHEGLFLKYAKNSGFDVLGIEPNKYAADYAKQAGIPTLVGGFEEVFEQINDKFEVIVLFHTLEHMQDYIGNLEKIKTILKPSGYLIIEVPNIESFRSRKYKDDWVYVYDEHLHYFSPPIIRNLLNRLGFSIKKIYHRDFDDMNLSIKSLLDRLLPFKFKNMNIKRGGENTMNKNKKITVNAPEKIFKTFLNPVRYFLAFLVKIFKRGDFILVVARLNP